MHVILNTLKYIIFKKHCWIYDDNPVDNFQVTRYIFRIPVIVLNMKYRQTEIRLLFLDGKTP